MFKLIESNGKNTKEVLSNSVIVWEHDTGEEKKGKDLGLNQNDLLYSGETTFRVSDDRIIFNLGNYNANKIRDKRLMVLHGKIYDITPIGISNFNERISLTGSRWSVRDLHKDLSARYLFNVGSELYNSKDNTSYIEIYR